MGFKTPEEGFAKDFSGEEVAYRTWKITALYDYRILTTGYNGEALMFEIKDSIDGGNTRLDKAFQVVHEDNKGRKDVVGFAPNVAFAKRMCANYTTNALAICQK